MTQVNRLATVVVPVHFLSYNRWLSWSGADGVTIAKVELTPESYAVDCALPVPVTKIYITNVTPNRPCLSCSTATTVSATSTTVTHTTDCVCPVSQLPQSLTPQTVSVLCNSYHSHSHHRLSVLCHSYHSHSHHRLCPSCATATTVTHTTDCPSCATATTVTHTTDRVHPVQQLPQSLTPHSHTTDYIPPFPWSKQ